MLASKKHILAEGRQFDVTILIICYLYVASLQHLQEVRMPIPCRNITPCTESFQCMQAFSHYRWRHTAFQDVCHKCKARLLICSLYCRECFLYDYGTIKVLRRILADITISTTAIAGLTKVIQENASAANLRLGILLHTLQFFDIYVALPTFLGKLTQGDQVLQVIEEDGLRWQPISAATSYLLIETLYTLGQIVMNDKSDIALVNAHTKCNRGTDDMDTVVNEVILYLRTFLRRQSSMIKTC